MTTKQECEKINHIIENEGFDYAFRCYDSFRWVKDKEFHKLREAYILAARALEDYIVENCKRD